MGLASELTLRWARRAVVTAVSNSGLSGCLSYHWCMSQAHPAPLPLLSKLNMKFPITFEDVRIGRALSRVLKAAEAPLLSFVAIASSNSEWITLCRMPPGIDSNSTALLAYDLETESQSVIWTLSAHVEVYIKCAAPLILNLFTRTNSHTKNPKYSSPR